jgi:hypothetical protein
MNATTQNSFRQADHLAAWLGGLGAILLAFLLSGCASVRSTSWGSSIFPGPEYQPTNVFRACAQLPTHLRRVAVLPISAPDKDWQAAAGRLELQQVIQSELGKAQRFEVVSVAPEQMRHLSGRETWRPDEKLPHDLLEKLRQQYDCEAVLLAHLQPYHAYQPIKVGWNLKLADLEARQIVWAADEVFDASDATVVRAAQRYYRDHGGGSGDDAGVLYSPRRFSQYTLAALFNTLPGR